MNIVAPGLTEVIGDEIQGLGVVLNFSIKAGQVESVQDIVFFDFTKIFIAF